MAQFATNRFDSCAIFRNFKTDHLQLEHEVILHYVIFAVKMCHNDWMASIHGQI